MKERFLREKHRLARLCLTGAMVGVCACIFSPPGTGVVPGSSYPEAVSEALDSLVSAAPDAVVDLYEPRLDPSRGSGTLTLLQEAAPVRVREQGGRVVEYRWSRETFGGWNERLEYLYNLYLLRVNFNASPGLFEDTAGLATTAALYARAHEHDPYTRYYDSASAEEVERSITTTEEPKVLGILVRVNDAGDSVFLKLVAPGSPAHRAGLRRGMAILAVNDSAVTGDSAAVRFVRFLEGDTAGPVLFTARGPAGVFSASMAREKVSFPSVVADSLAGTGYIYIGSFTAETYDGHSTATEFAAALLQTRRFPATVLDLRGNGGGDLTVTLHMCEQVLSGGTLFKIVERRQGSNRAPLRYEFSYRAHAGEAGEGRRFILLADSNSASASELFIAALRSGLGSPFVGTRTYGKGVGQIAFRTPGRGYALVTYARVRTAEGLDYNGTGLAPTQPSAARPDAMLAEALQLAAAPLAKGTQTRADLRARATLLEWNRVQARREGVTDLVFPSR